MSLYIYLCIFMFMYTTFFKSLGSVRFFIFLYIITVGQKPCNSTLKPVATGAKTNFSKKKKKIEMQD